MTLHFTSAQQLRRDHLQSLNSNEKKKCSHLLAVVWFIIYTCTGIR